MVVVREPDPGGIDGLSDAIQLFRIPPPIVERHRVFGRARAGIFHPRGILQPWRGADDVFESQILAELNRFIPLRQQISQGIMRTHAVQARLIHCLLHLARAVAEKAGGLQFAIAQSTELPQRSLIVLGQQISHRIKLQPDRQSQRIGHQPGHVAP